MGGGIRPKEVVRSKTDWCCHKSGCPGGLAIVLVCYIKPQGSPRLVLPHSTMEDAKHWHLSLECPSLLNGEEKNCLCKLLSHDITMILHYSQTKLGKTQVITLYDDSCGKVFFHMQPKAKVILKK